MALLDLSMTKGTIDFYLSYQTEGG